MRHPSEWGDGDQGVVEGRTPGAVFGGRAMTLRSRMSRAGHGTSGMRRTRTVRRAIRHPPGADPNDIVVDDAAAGAVGENSDTFGPRVHDTVTGTCWRGGLR
jgi:hypothetical protein